jgi:dienelactone hydrolase
MTSLILERPIDFGVTITAQDATIDADWSVPLRPKGAIVIASATGNARLGRRSRETARNLYDAGYATLLVDLLTLDEDHEDALTGALRLDVELLTSRILAAAQWIVESDIGDLPRGFLTSGIASAAAVVAAVREPELVDAIVSRGGRPDLAGIALHKLVTPTLLITGSVDAQIFELNRWALRRIRGEGKIAVIPGASHLFEEPGALEQMSRLAVRWFDSHLQQQYAAASFSLSRMNFSWHRSDLTAG